MINLNIDVIIVSLFLFVNLVVGLYYGRGVTTIKEYALGGKEGFSTAALVSTIVATIATGSSFMAGISRLYSSGLHYLIPKIGIVISLLLTAKFFIPKMKAFLGCVSVAESMGRYYGKNIRILAAICAIIANFGAVAVQYKALGQVLGYFTGIELSTVIITVGLIVTLYSAFGGIKSVTFTDIMQFSIFGTVIPMIGVIVWKSTINLENFSFANVLSTQNFDLSYIFDYSSEEFLTLIFLLFYFSVPALQPVLVQRISIGQNIKQVRKAFNISAIILLILILSIAWIGFLLLTLKPGMGSNELIPYMIDNYSHPGFKGLLVSSILAMAMSSADSFINVSSVLVANDIFKPLNFKAKNELMLTRICALVIGFSSIFLALSEKDLFGIILSANAYYMPVVMVPLLITVLGFRTSKKIMLNCMITTSIAVAIWQWSDNTLDPIMPTSLLNLIIIFAAHYLTGADGGWIKVDVSDETEGIAKTDSVYQSITNFNFKEFIHRNSPKEESTYSFFGVFCFISTLSTIYLTQQELIGAYGDLVLYFYQGMMLISTFFGLHMMWSDRIRNPLIVGSVWHISLIYNMTFCTSFFLFLSNFHHVQIIVFTLNLMVLCNICRWKTAISSIIIGVSLGIITYKNTIGNIPSNSVIDDNTNLILYVFLISAAALVTFSKPKEEYGDRNELKMKNMELEIGKRDLQISALLKDINGKEWQAKNFLRDIILVQRELSNAKNDINDRETNIAKLNQEIQAHKLQYTQLNQQGANQNNHQTQKLNEEITISENKIAKLKEEINSGHTNVNKLSEEIIDKQNAISTLNEEVLQSKQQAAIFSSEVKNYEYEIIKLKGVINSKDSKITDLSERVDFYSDRVINHEKEIERLGATSQKILNNVTHELRLPVGNVINFAEMLSESLDKCDKDHLRDLSDEVLQNSARLSTMILNMLDLATLDIKKLSLKKSVIDLGKLIYKRAERCKKIYLGGKDLKLKLDLAANINADVDLNYITQVIDNLIINAIKFSEQGTIEIKMNNADDNAVIITVKDEGKGIPQNDLYDIFTPFKMGSNTESKSEGRGVGLSLCKSAIEAHGGYIRVESIDNKGALFTIMLPLLDKD